MRILHWDEMFHPSFGYQINVLTKFQAQQGHEVIIVTSDNIQNHPTFRGFSNHEDIEQEDELFSRKYKVNIIRLPIYGVVSGRVIYQGNYIRKIRELNADVIMCHTNDTLSSIRIAQQHKQIGTPIVFDNHMLEMASTNPFAGVFRLYFRMFVTPIIVQNKWIVIRTQDDDYVNRRLGIPENQTPFISFGSDTTIFHPDRDARRQFRMRNDIRESDFVVVYAGKLVESKGGKFLAEAFRRKFETRRNIVLVVVGNTAGPYGQEVDGLLGQSENRVLRLPTQRYSDLARYYQMADLAVFPRQCSLSFFDVQACGLPVVSENNSVNVDRMRRNNGFVFTSGDKEDFRSKIALCAEMKDTDYDTMKKNAFEYIIENYDYRNIAQRYTEFLLEEMRKTKEARQ